MKRILQFTGLLAWVVGIGYGVLYLKEHFKIFNEFLRITGLITITLGIFYMSIQVIWGDRWFVKGGKTFFIGNNLIEAINQFLKE